MITAFVLLGIGLLAIFIEFFLPGGIFGTIGALFVVASLAVFAMESDSLLYTVLYFIGTITLVVFLIRFALWRIRSGRAGYSLYSDRDQEGYLASSWDRSLVEKEGVVVSVLRPSGHVLIDGKRYSAISQSGYVDRDEKVVVVGGEGECLIVKPKR